MAKIDAMPMKKSRIDAMEALLKNIASVATAIEALEDLLIQKNVLKPDELMQNIKRMVHIKMDPQAYMPGEDD